MADLVVGRLVEGEGLVEGKGPASIFIQAGSMSFIEWFSRMRIILCVGSGGTLCGISQQSAGISLRSDFLDKNLI
jgi:hypothetical protein